MSNPPKCKICGQESYHPFHIPGQRKTHEFEPQGEIERRIEPSLKKDRLIEKLTRERDEAIARIALLEELLRDVQAEVDVERAALAERTEAARHLWRNGIDEYWVSNHRVVILKRWPWLEEDKP